MNKYNEVEVQTAKNLIKEGYKWIVRDTRFYGNAIYAHKEKPHKEELRWLGTLGCRMVCTDEVPIFQSVGLKDTEPTSLESIVHPQILDDDEKRYLEGVIRPFRDKVLYITKKSVISDSTIEYISIQLAGPEYIWLPRFNKGTMYKGMEPDHRYTLEELGL